MLCFPFGSSQGFGVLHGWFYSFATAFWLERLGWQLQALDFSKHCPPDFDLATNDHLIHRRAAVLTQAGQQSGSLTNTQELPWLP